MADFPKKLRQKLTKRTAEDAYRKLPVTNNLVDFSSNDYLGFSRNFWIKGRTKEILKQQSFKNGATGSRLLSGNHQLYQKLEQQLTSLYSCEAALVFNSGYDANLGFFASVPQRGDFIFYDEYMHASIRDGIQLSNAKSYKFHHNNLGSLQSSIERSIKVDSKTALFEIYIVTESVFSMDGDTPDLKALATFCSTNNYHLVVDEAHAAGVFGKGLCLEKEIQQAVFARIVTFGKALGSHGAAILGSKLLKEYLVNFARSFIYTTALSPHSIATSIAAHEQLISKNGNISQTKLLENISYFKQELEINELYNNFIKSNSAIQCMKVEGNQNVKTISKKLIKNGYDIKAILSPTVPKGKERLRFCLHAYNTKEEIKSMVQILKKYIDE
ncbi:aminotransferase class I/II-fold pyridoxal phosphate-dependent enzyme [uncultured Croceitalea sp.]|uniref:aminotransferase class I/II-fold pyridoxal phosphate-dependent enzyme n=1 Tax=uncultured Croceitalea sp. TaxID=1798908 RepID=UPI00374E85E9